VNAPILQRRGISTLLISLSKTKTNKQKKKPHTKTHLPVNYGGRNAYKSIFIYCVKFRKSACPTTEPHISKSLSTCLLCDKLPVKAVKTQSIIFETFSSYSI